MISAHVRDHTGEEKKKEKKIFSVKNVQEKSLSRVADSIVFSCISDRVNKKIKLENWNSKEILNFLFEIKKSSIGRLAHRVYNKLLNLVKLHRFLLVVIEHSLKHVWDTHFIYFM